MDKHHDRTVKQRIRWRCLSPTCYEIGKRSYYEFNGDYPRCPRCSAIGDPYVQMLSLTHFMLQDSRGPIFSQGIRYRIACDSEKKREHMATFTNNEAATGDIAVTNCPGCLEAIRKLSVKCNMGLAISPEGTTGNAPPPHVVAAKLRQSLMKKQTAS